MADIKLNSRKSRFIWDQKEFFKKFHNKIFLVFNSKVVEYRVFKKYDRQTNRHTDKAIHRGGPFLKTLIGNQNSR